MLSRVAEELYWMSRHLERAENMARIVNVHENLLLDLPKKIPFGWQSTILITGGNDLFYELYEEPDEKSVIRFLIGDKKNPSSLFSCIIHARENVRTTRDIIPRESWELLNDVYHNIKNNMSTALGRRGRYAFLNGFIGDIHQITGLLAGTMTHDEGYAFLRLGRNLERADMTTRIIDVRSADLIENRDSELSPFDNIQWVSVLKSLTAYQMYRQFSSTRVKGSLVLKFLLQNEQFPRSVSHCICEVKKCIESLPNNDSALREVMSLQRLNTGTDIDSLAKSGFHDHIDNLQAQIGSLHAIIDKSYFLPEFE
ncbi:MAG: alpha-E domain-containing protein [Pseudomonadota bacterium]